ncbi:DUF2971 domain-containing protein [uncultured Maribacter sp.]|uniref:DUF2971 domain-containing protein n=1 Tax=uncultured Maribacter sp. TaxID=431308 RepID=UPI00261AF27E|nr:DUF2971 domain-containing protein [uncultured Maribacter sp.]
MSEKLYHYSTFSKFINGISKTNSIRLSSILNVNDPLDYKDRVYRNHHLFKKGEGISIENLHKLTEEYKTTLNTKWITNCKIACFSTSNEENKLKGYQLANLWSYYAENHTGICIVLNKEKVVNYFKENFKLFHPLCEQVDYKDRLSYCSYKIDYTNNEIKGVLDNKSTLFFEKLKSWDREQEYRLICFSKNEFEYIPLEGMIEEIILGQKISLENQEIIKGKNLSINISKMNYFGGDGKFEKIAIKSNFWKEMAEIEKN